MPTNKDKPSRSNTRAPAPPDGSADRRSKFAGREKRGQASRHVRFDDKGNPVFEIRTDVPRRRKDDDTIDLLKCLENDSLSLAEDES